MKFLGTLAVLLVMHGSHALASQRTDSSAKDLILADANLIGLVDHLDHLPEDTDLRLISDLGDISALAGDHQYANVHLLTHGAPGQLRIGDRWLGLADPDASATRFANDIRQLLAGDSRLWIYGCDFGAGVSGNNAIEFLTTTTGARLQASTDKTGHADLNGNWTFEIGDAAATDNRLVTQTSLPRWNGVLQNTFDWDVAVWAAQETAVDFAISTVNMNLTTTGGASGAGFDTPTEAAVFSGSGGNGDGQSLLMINTAGVDVTYTMTFSQPVSGLQFSLYDVDNTETVTITSTNGVSPTLTAENAPSASFSIAGNVATGNGGSSTNDQDLGTLNVSFPQAVSSVTVVGEPSPGPNFVVLGLSDITINAPAPPVSACPTPLDALDWDVQSYPAGDLDETFMISDINPFPDVEFQITYSGNTADFTGGAPLENGTFTGAGGIGGGGSALQLLHDPTPDTDASGVTINIGFSDTLQDVRFAIMDIDGFVDSIDFRDQVVVRGFDGVTEISPTFEALSNGSTIGFSGNTLQGHNYDDASDNSPRSTANIYFTQAIDRIELEYSDSANIGGDRTIFITDIQYCPPSSLPVTISHVDSRQTAQGLEINWETASETNQAGFEIQIPVGDQWITPADGFITSAKTLSTKPIQYNQSIKLPQSVSQFRLISVDTLGHKQAFGPYQTGVGYGQVATETAIDWPDVRKDVAVSLAKNGWQHDANGILRKSTIRKNGSSFAHVQVSSNGIQRVSYESLAAAGVDLAGVDVSEIAVSFRGQPVSRHIVTADASGIFGPGANIDFLGDAPSGLDALYLNELAYQITLDPALVAIAKVNNGAAEGEMQSTYIHQLAVENQRTYDFSMPGEEPWYDQRILAFGAPASSFITLPFDAAMANQGQASLELGLIGVTNFRDDQGNGPDHHVQVILNQDSTPLIDARNDGLVEWNLQRNIPVDQLAGQSNQLEIRVPADTGYPFDLIYLDAYQLSYPRHFAAIGDQINFAGQTNHFQITGFSTNDLIAYAEDDTGLTALSPRTVGTSSTGQQTISLAGVAVDGETLFGSGFETGSTTTATPPRAAHYWVSSASQISQPPVVAGDTDTALPRGSIDYLIIAHPAFIGEPLSAYAAQKSSAGMSTAIVDVTDIYQRYGFGMALPSAIQAYLREAADTLGYDHVLLVGGDSYDYRNYTGQQSISYIPTRYANTQGIINFTPSDGLLVDFNADSVPDKSIGRWPVRTETELQAAIDKSFDFELRWLNNQQSALLVAAQAESGIIFSNQTERLADVLAESAANVAEADLDRLYLDVIAGQQPPPSDLISAAQQQLINSINQGRTITMFSGHGSPTMWTFQGLLTPSVASSLNNEGQPTLISPLTCYTTYWVDPGTNTLAHQLINNGQRGAAAIHGAATLSRYQDNERMSQRVIDRMLNHGDTLGTAILRAKQELSDSGDRFQDVIINWALLGDPTLRLTQ